MYKLSDIFNADNIKQKRKILSNFPITKEDRNKTLVGSMNSSGGSSNSEGGFTYKSRKVVWKVNESAEKSQLAGLFVILNALPFYCISYKDSDLGHIFFNKYYGNAANFLIGAGYVEAFNGLPITLISYIEECEGNFTVKIAGSEKYVTYNGSLVDYVIKGSQVTTPDSVPTEEEVIQMFASMGITQVPYEEYASIDVNQEYGCLTLTN